jgi:soluble P-type ATPase
MENLYHCIIKWKLITIISLLMKMQKNIYVKSSDGNGTIHRLSKKFAKDKCKIEKKWLEQDLVS